MKIQHTAFTEHLVSKQGLSPAEFKWVDGLVLVKKKCATDFCMHLCLCFAGGSWNCYCVIQQEGTGTSA